MPEDVKPWKELYLFSVNHNMFEKVYKFFKFELNLPISWYTLTYINVCEIVGIYNEALKQHHLSAERNQQCCFEYFEMHAKPYYFSTDISIDFLLRHEKLVAPLLIVEVFQRKC